MVAKDLAKGIVQVVKEVAEADAVLLVVHQATNEILSRTYWL